MSEKRRAALLTFSGWGLGFVALLPLALIAGVCLVAPVDWRTKLIVIGALAGISAALVFGSSWCFAQRDKRAG